MTSPFAAVFLFTVTIATITPGPSMLLALNHGIRFGARRALATALGNVCGTAIQCLVSFAGLGLILAKLGWALAAIRYVGAAYLVYVGVMTLLADPLAVTTQRTTGRHGLFLEALLVTLANPKAIFFFSALFPQFIGETLTIGRAAWMLGSVLVITFGSMMLYATAGQRLQLATASLRVRRWFTRTVGATFVGLGLGLAFDRK